MPVSTGATALMDRVFWAALAVYLFVLPIANTIAVRYLAFIALIAVTIAALVSARALPTLPFARCWLAYFLVALLSVVFAVDPAMSLSELRVEVVYCIVVFMVGVTWGSRHDGFERFALLLAVINLTLTSAAFSVASLGMSYQTDILKLHPIPYAGMDGNWLLVALFLNAWLAWQLWGTGRKALPLMLLALVVLDLWAMMATHNRQNLVATGAGITVAAMLLLHRRFSWRSASVFLGLLAVIASLLAAQVLRRDTARIASTESPASVGASIEGVGDAVTAATTGDVRWLLWKFSLQKIAEHPWVGGGIGRPVFDKLYPEFMSENTQLWHAHNMILNKGIQMGIPGMLAFVALWLALLRELLRHARSPLPSRDLAVAGVAFVAAIFVKNMTDDFFVRNIALSFWLISGLMVGYLRAAARRPASAEH